MNTVSTFHQIFLDPIFVHCLQFHTCAVAFVIEFDFTLFDKILKYFCLVVHVNLAFLSVVLVGFVRT